MTAQNYEDIESEKQNNFSEQCDHHITCNDNDINWWEKIMMNWFRLITVFKVDSEILEFLPKHWIISLDETKTDWNTGKTLKKKHFELEMEIKCEFQKVSPAELRLQVTDF